jgi:hypothetical protein
MAMVSIARVREAGAIDLNHRTSICRYNKLTPNGAGPFFQRSSG